MIFGSQSGLLWVFEANNLQKNHYINSTGDAIVCLLTLTQQLSPINKSIKFKRKATRKYF